MLITIIIHVRWLAFVSSPNMPKVRSRLNIEHKAPIISNITKNHIII